MSVTRPTLSENWHKVAELRPRLRPGIRVTRLVIRSRLWYVIEDPLGMRHVRVNQPAYRMIALLDGRRSVEQAWELAAQSQGDAAPTQGEAINLLSQLNSLNVLRLEHAGNTEALVRQRRTRRTREMRGFASNLLFIRLPLWNPNGFLDRVTPLFAWLVSPLGATLWCLLLLLGVWSVVGESDRLWSAGEGVIDANNLPILYAVFVAIKAIHELGHAIACKVFGRRYGGCEVPTIGAMLLVLLPVPYVDASASWALPSKWKRAVIAGAGIIVEVSIASIAAFVWAHSSEGTAVSAIAYNTMFVASVSTVLFNANPLLRFDGYHALTDIAELPNLAKRANDQVLSYIKRHIWGLRSVTPVATTRGEEVVLSLYAVASGIYRVFIVLGIVLMIADKHLLLGTALILLALVGFVLVPAWKGVEYILTSQELQRQRPRALLTTAGTVCAVLLVVGLVPFPDYARVVGVVEAGASSEMRAGSPGFLTQFTPARYVYAGDHLARLENDALATQATVLDAEMARLRTAERQALASDPASLDVVREQMDTVRSQIQFVNEHIAELNTTANRQGLWIPAITDRTPGSWIGRDEPLGSVCEISTLRVRAFARQHVNALIAEEGARHTEVRPRARPADRMPASLVSIRPAGAQRLPSAAMSASMNGPIPTDPTDPSATLATEPFFELIVEIQEPRHELRFGQRVDVRIRLEDKTILERLYRNTMSILQRRLRIQ